MTRHDEIRRSYRELGEIGNLCDGIITRSTLLGKLMDGLIFALIPAALVGRLITMVR